MGAHIIRTFAAGALLSIGGCAKDVEPTTPEAPPATPETPEPPPTVIPEVGGGEMPMPTVNPPPPPPPININPPPPDRPDGIEIDPTMQTLPPPQHLPTWDDIKSSHPEGATNPPMPALIVKAEDECYKAWESPFRAKSGADMGNRVDPKCDKGDSKCGTRIQCPPEAAQMWADAGKKK